MTRGPSPSASSRPTAPPPDDPVRVAIAGGHGQIALRLTRLLADGGDTVRGLIRNLDHAADVEAAGAEAVVCDLETAGVEEVGDALVGADAAVFAAGAGPGSGARRKETMDYAGAAKLIAAARDRGVRRFVMVSSRGADPDAEGGDMAPYLRAKGRADAELAASDLDFTIVRPGRLTNDAGTGKIDLEGSASGSIPRDDVAAVLAAVLRDRAGIGATFDVVSGDVPIADALRALPS
jgi:nucleoside-diphosphate-sugar epimerase